MSHPHIRVAPQPQPTPGERLDSWKEIARYLNRDVRTVQRWEETDGLPVYRRPGSSKRSPVYAYTSEIDAWLRQAPPAAAEPPAPEPLPWWKTARIFRLAALLLAVAVAGSLASYFLMRQPQMAPPHFSALTSLPGVERQPAFSPDGEQVVFSWNGPNQDNFNLYTKFVAGGQPHPLTSDPGIDGWPAWSPDSSSIAFCRWTTGKITADVLIISPYGGPERQLYQVRLPAQVKFYWPGICWTHDSKWVVSQDSGSTPGLVLIPVETGHGIQKLMPPVPGSAGDCCPAISTDGSKLAFLRSTSGRTWNVFTQQLGTDNLPIGDPIQLTREAGTVQNPIMVLNPMWMGKDVLYITESHDGDRKLWRVPHDGSRPAVAIESLGAIREDWAISRDGRRLTFSDRYFDHNIYDMDIGTKKVDLYALSSIEDDAFPEISPDGTRVVFMSAREKGKWFWVANTDGSNAIPVAPASGEYARWSPDSSQIVFGCQDQGNDEVCVVPAGGGAYRILTHNPARDYQPSWSNDGNWIYFTSDRSGEFQIYRMPAGGEEKARAEQMTKGGGYTPIECGSTLYFARPHMESEIWKLDRDGKETRVGSFKIKGYSLNYAVGPDGIYYKRSDNPDNWFEIMLYRFSTGIPESVRIVHYGIWGGISVARGGRVLWFTAAEPRSLGNLQLIENFR